MYSCMDIGTALTAQTPRAPKSESDLAAAAVVRTESSVCSTATVVATSAAANPKDVSAEITAYHIVLRACGVYVWLFTFNAPPFSSSPKFA